MIEGLRQAVQYGSSSHRLYFRLRHMGADLSADDRAEYSKAIIDFASYCTALDTIIEFNTAGSAAFDWTVFVIEGGACTCNAYDDINAIGITYDDGVTTVADVEAAITALAGADDVIDVKTAGTGASVLNKPADSCHAVFSNGLTPTVTIYDPEGTEILAETDLTQDSGAVYYVDIDASATATWDKGVDYKAKIKYGIGGSTRLFYDYVFFDVAQYPFNRPLVSSEEITAMRPGWDLPEGWTDWTQAIEEGHADLTTELLNLRDNQGDRIYPFRAIDRNQLRKAALWYCFRAAARVIRLTETEHNEILDMAASVMPTLIHLDRDDQLDKDDDEEAAQAITFVR
jgi:hypothetical protein